MSANRSGKPALAQAPGSDRSTGGSPYRPGPLVITGFMGTGKTSVGRLVAQRMGRPFVDMDAVIEAREGVTIREIFDTRGEAYFRQCEVDLCTELAAQSDLVIATGGGTLVNPRNRESFSKAFLVCLDATTETLSARLEKANDRPLLRKQGRRENLQALSSSRRSAYERIERHVDTNGKSIEQVAAEITAMFQAGQNGE